MTDNKMNFKKSLIFIAVIMCLGIICTLAMAPLCVPDEEIHYNDALYMSNQMLKAVGHNDLRIPAAMDQIVSFRDGSQTVSFWTDWTTGQELVDSKFGTSWEGTMPSFPYIWLGLFLAITRLMGAPYQVILIVSRLANLLFFALIAALSIYVCPQMKWAVMTVSFLPSTVWGVNSFSYDMWNTAFAVLYVAYIARCMTLDKIKIRNIVGIFIFMMLFLPTKFIYFPMALLIFMPSYKKLDRKDKRNIIIFGGVALAIVGGVLWYLRGPEVIAYFSFCFDLRAEADYSNVYTLSIIIHHPFHVFYVIVATFIEYTQHFIIKSICGENYSQHVPGFLQFAIIVVFVLLISGSVNIRRTDSDLSSDDVTEFCSIRARLIAAFIYVVNSIGFAVAFLLMFNIYSEGEFRLIVGMQGRYYLPLLMLLPFILNNRFWKPDEKTMKKLMVALIALNVVVTFCKFAGVMET
ncbi:DUF2142 domain-containing protein [Butyrivibrio fibrisolvens]|uniref:DUF2142 domain-containing protein n=1 Tax=Butyrivibrio fibrisolvens TaxID=831 RepID=A0A317FZA6_BUTFI|nr:DUF2142 domain-containing protein [Butyrivibrio fibrisolvens]PWT26191.1 hypothetical protein CPT75_03180 [Butyrivibrio fibrisolvens]